MESFLDWLIIAIIKAVHIPFLTGGYATIENQKESELLDLDELGDNVPYVFIKKY